MRILIVAVALCVACSCANAATQAMPPTSQSAALMVVVSAPPIDNNDETDERQRDEVVLSTVAEGLNNPFCVSIESDSDRIFIAESGAQRIVEIKDGKIIPVAGEFTPTKYRGYDAGPLSLFCVGENVLIAGHDNADGVGTLTKLTLVPNVEDPSESEVTRESITIDTKNNATKLGQFLNIMVKHSIVYVVTRGDEDNGWIAVADFQKGKLASLRPSIPTAKRTNCPKPTCSTMSPGGEYLVVSHMGTEGETQDSRLAFYTLQGKIVHDFQVELQDIVAIAYSPTRGHLFAIDHNFADPSKGGLYKLIGKGTDKCDVKKLMDIGYATSMAFDPKGNLFVTTLGGPQATDGTLTGKLLKIEGLDERLEEPKYDKEKPTS